MTVPIDESEVRRIARLARLNLSDDELRLLAGQLGNILEYFRQIESVNTDGVQPLAHALPLTDVLREDKPRQGLSHQHALANAPARQGECLRVPAVIDPHAGA